MGALGFLVVTLGGAIGAVARYALSSSINNRRKGLMPVGTMAVNIVGSIVIGFLFTTISPLFGGVWLTHDLPTANAWTRLVTTLLITGFCGGFTTFSTATVDAVTLAQAGHTRQALASTFITLVATLVAVSVGALMGGLLTILALRS